VCQVKWFISKGNHGFIYSSGVTKDDYWLVDGSRDFSLLPANTITGWDIDLPIRLHVGNVAYG
jgi:hypothetical protein